MKDPTKHQISRRRVLTRARFGWPRKTVEFSQETFHQPDNYRQNAAGYVCMAFAIPLDAPHSWGGLSTVTLETDGWFYEIQPHTLKPGDLIGHLGVNSIDADGGSAVIFEKWLNDDPSLGMALTWEHLPAVGTGPDQRARPVDYRVQTYRYSNITDDQHIPV